jgi:hypothetical protein
VDDPLLGTVERSVELGSGQTTQAKKTINLAKAYKSTNDGTVTGPLPGVAPGDYHFIVRTDLANAVRETEDANNGTTSAQTVQATMPALSLGSSASLGLRDGSSRYYRIDVPSDGEDLVFDLQSDASSGSAQLYLRRGAVPTRSTFDARADAPFNTTQSITLPTAQAGTYYVLARAASIPDSTSFTLSAQTLTFGVQKVTPAQGGNGGVVTTDVRGSQFDPDATLYLQSDDGTRTPAQGTFQQTSTRLIARLNLRNQPLGTYDVVVQNPDGSETVAPDAFTVEPSQGPDVAIETKWPSDVRSGSDIDIEVTITNRGNENAVDFVALLAARGYVFRARVGENVPGFGTPFWWEGIPQDITLLDDAPQPFDLGVDLSGQSFSYTRPKKTEMLPFWIYELPPGASQSFTATVKSDIGRGGIVHAGKVVHMPDSRFKRTAAPEDIETSAGFQMMQDALDETTAALAGGASSKQTADQAEQGLRDMVETIGSYGLPVSLDGIPSGGFVGTVGGGVVGYLAVGALYTNPATATLATGVALGSMVGGFYGSIYDITNTADEATEEGTSLLENVLDFGGNETNVRNSKDPNDIVGPDGHGDANWVARDRSLGYRIRFENDPERATAPAQVVEIRHPLDANVDTRSFELGTIGFANQTFEVPTNRASYSTRLDVRDSLGVFVDVTAGLDVQANEAFWRLTSIDPQTGSQPTSDPFAGFLPVNDSTGRGEGFVRYQIEPSADATTGTEIDAEADIVFDRNAPIETPVVTNTVDADAPESNLTVVPRTSQDNAFTLSWNGTDPGAGVDRFQLYVAKGDSGRFQPYQSSVQDTSLVFVGEKNQTYRFYTRASDFVGNEEPSKSVGDTTRALPVELTNFAASIESGGTVLQWSTASETNNAGFHVERRIDDEPFRHLGFVEGRGTSAEAHTYRFRDADLPFEAETIEYRLRQIDVDGTSEHFGPVVVERGAPDRFALHGNYPNPAVQQTTLPYELAQPGDVNVRLYDVLGRRVLNAPLGRKSAGRYIHPLDVSRLASGTYFFELRVERDGQTVFREVQKVTLVK